MPITTDPYKATDLLLIDGYNLAYRSWLATNFTKSFKNEHGYPTCHIYNSMMKLRMWLNAVGLKSGRMVCPVFSFQEDRSFRRQHYAKYKAQREKEDYKSYDITDWQGELVTQVVDPVYEVESIMRLFPGLHLTTVDGRGETDDILSTFVNIHRRRKGVTLWLMTNDHDAWFDLRDNVNVGGDIKKMTTVADLRKPPTEHGFSTANPRKVPLAKALFGDTSDNIEKVPKATERTVGAILRKCQRDPDRDGVLYGPGFLREVRKVLKRDPENLAKCIVGNEKQILDMEKLIRPANTLQLVVETSRGDVQKLRRLLSWYGIKKDINSYVGLASTVVA